VQLDSDGSLSGRILGTSTASMVGDTAYLLSNGSITQSVQVSANGTFSFVNVAPGLYGLITAGASGYSAQGFEAIGSGSSFTANTTEAGKTLVAQPAAPSPVLPAVPIPSPITDPTVDEIRRNYPEVGGPIEPSIGGEPIADFGAPIASPFGGFGGGTPGGGGGGFGGFGGVGGLGGLGAAAALAAISDDNDAITAPVVSSPVVPN
ncbi:MAG: hypothetical protein AAF664_23875, partial [Planctomycetota bacterium]